MNWDLISFYSSTFTFLTGRCYRICTNTETISILILASIAFITMAVLHISIHIINKRDRNFQNSIQLSNGINQSIILNQNNSEENATFNLEENSSFTKNNNLTLISVFLLTVQCVIAILFIYGFGESNPYSVRIIIVFLTGLTIPGMIAFGKPKIRDFLLKTWKSSKAFYWLQSFFQNSIHPQH